MQQSASDGRLPTSPTTPGGLRGSVSAANLGSSGSPLGASAPAAAVAADPAPPPAGLVSVKLSGFHGLNWEGTRVTRSVLKAWMSGVRPGWSFHSIDGQITTNGDEVGQALEKCATSERKYEILFVKGQGNFGTEAKERELLIKRNRALVRKAFAFQGYIERGEHRAITIEQLLIMLGFAGDYCIRWHDTAPARLSKTSGQKLNMDTLNFHHINAWIVLPATQKKRCSFVECLTLQSQIPAWFASHWWGEPAVGFVACLQAHAAVHRLPSPSAFNAAEAPYWVCAFATRQHTPQEGLTEDAKKSYLYKALEVTRFRMLLVLDARVTSLSRMWCNFEQTLGLDHPCMPLDIAIVRDNKVEVVTQGLTEEEQHMELQSPGMGIKFKAAREAGFPVEIAALCMDIQVQEAQVTNDEDQAQILNCITGRTLSSPPLTEHPRYTETNKRLHALFAALLWSKVSAGYEASPAFVGMEAEEAEEEEEGVNRFALASKALRGDVWRKTLDLYVGGLSSGQLTLLASSIPPNLQSLALRLRGGTFDDKALNALAAGLPPHLKSLAIDFTLCRSISDEGIAALANALDFKATAVDFKLAETPVTKEVQDWYVAETARNEAEGANAACTFVARTLGLSLCRDPEVCSQYRRRVVPAVHTMQRIVAQADEGDEATLRAAGRARRALAALGEEDTTSAASPELGG